MNTYTRTTLFLLRIAMGWLFFYAGITKVTGPDWSAAGYLENARTFPEFFAWFAQPEILPWTNLLNEWGITLIGISLILGAFVRWSALAGTLLMGLYYVPVLNFPYVDHGYIVDSHIIYILVFALLAFMNAGYTWGLDRRLRG